MKTKFMHSKDILQVHIVVGSDDIKEMKEYILRIGDEYVPRVECGNLAENKIRIEGIYYNKTCL